MAGTMGAAAVTGSAAETAADVRINVHVDARDVSKRLLTSTVTLSGLQPGMLDLWYPKFIPGNHAASGPIHNVGGLRVRTVQGEKIVWDRNPAEPRQITIEVPPGADAIEIETTYITNQPAPISRSSDSYGFPAFGAINWNTLVWYPGQLDLSGLRAGAVVSLPVGWSAAGAGFEQDGQELRRSDVPFMELIDTPVVFGKHLRSVALDAPHGRAHFMHSIGHDAQRSHYPAWMVDRTNAMIAEAELIFGPFPREDYHFLVLCDDSLRFGLEHGRTTFVSAGTDELLDGQDEPEEDALTGGMAGLTVLPHEYIHAWNGKLASPSGILRTNYHDALDTSLLWVYEGLTTYYTDVLAARAGMLSSEEYAHRLTSTIERYMRQDGRTWRSIEDTALDVEHVRQPSPNWEDLRRRADYYADGALFWLEADAIIRRATSGERSLDDFCKAFFDVPALPVGQHHGYTRDDVVRTLTDVWAEENWDALIRVRIETPAADLSYDRMLRELGRDFVRRSDATALQRRADKSGRGLDLRATIGFSVNKTGDVTSVRIASPADQAGLRHGAKLMAVDDLVFSLAGLREAARATADGSALRLLVGEYGAVREIIIEDGGGLTYPRLEQIEGAPNILSAVIAPRRPSAAR